MLSRAAYKYRKAFIERLRDQLPDVAVGTIDLYDRSLPSVAGDNIKSKYTLMAGMPIDDRHAQSWREIETLIDHFLSADLYLISTPMWNLSLSIPYALKYDIDCIVQPGYLFRYNDIGQVTPWGQNGRWSVPPLGAAITRRAHICIRTVSRSHTPVRFLVSSGSRISSSSMPSRWMCHPHSRRVR